MKFRPTWISAGQHELARWKRQSTKPVRVGQLTAGHTRSKYDTLKCAEIPVRQKPAASPKATAKAMSVKSRSPNAQPKRQRSVLGQKVKAKPAASASIAKFFKSKKG